MLRRWSPLLAVAGAVVLIGHLVMVDLLERYGLAGDARFYSAMADGEAVPGPYRWRVLAPWLAGSLPVSSLEGLRLVTYASLGLGYVVTLWTAQRLGVGLVPGVLALVAVAGRPAHLMNYANPFLADGTATASVAGAAAAIAVGSFPLLVVSTLGGTLAREAMASLLSAWLPSRRLRPLIVGTAAVVVPWLAVWALSPVGDDFVYGASPLSVPALGVRAAMGWSFLWVTLFGFLVLDAGRRAKYLTLGATLTGIAVITVLVFQDTLRMLQPLTFLLVIGLALILQRCSVWVGIAVAMLGATGVLTHQHSRLSLDVWAFPFELGVALVGIALLGWGLWRSRSLAAAGE